MKKDIADKLLELVHGSSASVNSDYSIVIDDIGELITQIIQYNEKFDNISSLISDIPKLTVTISNNQFIIS